MPAEISLSRSRTRQLLEAVAALHGRTVPGSDDTDLRDIPFRSLDFSELALRVEDEIGRELNFDAPGLRRVRTVGDVLDLIAEVQSP